MGTNSLVDHSFILKNKNFLVDRRNGVMHDWLADSKKRSILGQVSLKTIIFQFVSNTIGGYSHARRTECANKLVCERPKTKSAEI